LPKCSKPTGIDYDPKSGVLVTACRNSVAKVIDAKTGSDQGTVVIGEGADGVIFDAARRLVYVPCNAGVLSIFALGNDGTAGPVKNVPTQRFARTAALDPRSGKLFLPVSRKVKTGADHWKGIPGTFEVLVVAPK
jgi:DNA-binding beta-propeller fold protein YncE